MIEFKTVQNLNEATKQKLTKLVSLMKLAAKVDQNTMSQNDFYNHQEVSAALALMKDKDILVALKNKFLPAELMLYAEINGLHPVALTLLRLAEVPRNAEGVFIVEFPPEMKLKFLHTCVYADTVDVSKADGKGNYTVRPVDTRTSKKPESVKTRSLTEAQLFEYYKKNRAFPTSQSTEQDMFNVLAYCVQDPTRSTEMLNILNKDLERVQRKYQSELVNIINEAKKLEGIKYIESAINEAGELNCRDEDFLAILKILAAQETPGNTGAFFASNKHEATRKVMQQNLAALVEIANNNNNQGALAVLAKLTSSKNRF